MARKTKKEIEKDDVPMETTQIVETETDLIPKKKSSRKTKKDVEQEKEEQKEETTNVVLTVIEKPLEDTDEDKDPKALKKRGRKPKGGKIIQVMPSVEQPRAERPNITLHLKCSMKDLQLGLDCCVESYSFVSKSDLNYNILGSNNVSVETFKKPEHSFSSNYCDDDDDEEEDCSVNPNGNKDVWKKLKALEHNLHINNINNKKSACFWDTCEFDNPPTYIPKHYINGTYHVYGCFCSPECGVAYLMNEPIDSSTKFERYHLFNHIYAKIYDYKKNIKPAPNPYYMLEKFYGNLKIHEYRSLLRNERLFLIVDKPLTRILPELHEDNDDFILNNKIIPSNTNYQVKNKLNKKKQTKTNILNEKFGGVGNGWSASQEMLSLPG
jgi:hypothetical protein